jgi:hypothetical protein
VPFNPGVNHLFARLVNDEVIEMPFDELDELFVGAGESGTGR